MMEEKLREIERHLFHLFHHSDIFKKLKEIVQKNEKLKEMDHTALRWMENAFINDLVIRFACLLDDSNNVISFVKLLQDVKRDRQLISRDRFVQRYRSQQMANRDYNNYVGEGIREFPEDQLTTDINILRESEPCKKILNFRNNYVGHISRNIDDIPTLDELFEALNVVEDVFKKYHLLITAGGLITATPYIQSNWSQVFTIPWIEDR